MLEIGCASGWNLVPMAQSLPESTFVGIDLSAIQITEACSLAGQCGVDNVSLMHADILEVDDSWGRFDYIICHGIYSWVPQPVREKILDICRNNLATDVVAQISYNTYPRWHVKKMVRDMMHL